MRPAPTPAAGCRMKPRTAAGDGGRCSGQAGVPADSPKGFPLRARARLAGQRRGRGAVNSGGRWEAAALPGGCKPAQKTTAAVSPLGPRRGRIHPSSPASACWPPPGGADGELAVATDRALHHQDGRAWARLGWEQVDQVRWDEQRHTLTLTSLTPAAPAQTLLRLVSSWDLPAVASERVTWARLVDQRVWLNGRAGARVVARRAPGEPSITWLVILDHGLDPADPAVRAAVESALTDLRAVTGVDEAAAE